MRPVRFSIVIPTYQRCETVVRTVAALDRQVHRNFEVVVVDDGSTDGTAAALRSLRLGFPLTVVEQGNHGAAQARNAGAAVATGDILLFLDDDMEADPAMLQEHARSQRTGADVVLGDLPLHPDSPPNVLSRAVGDWARRRGDRLAAEGAEIPLADLLTGQMSIRREWFERIGRFDVSFTRDGLYGGEDVDFGYRVLKAGSSVTFNPAAISFQYYDVDPADYLRRGYEAGRSEHELIVKHPERAEQLGRGPHLHARLSRWLLGPFVLAPAALSAPLRATVAALVRSGRGGRRLRAAFLNVRAMEYRRGARDARRALSAGQAVVLAYHAIADLSHERRLWQYGVPPAQLAMQLDELIGHGWSFVGLDALLRALRGKQQLPARAVLLTFDDAYADLLSAAIPILAARGIPAVAFAVSGRVGGTNEWDREIAAGTLRLLDAAGLRALSEHGVEIGSHGYAHRRLTPALAPDELAAELEGSAQQLQALGLPRPRVLSYPYGVWSPTIATAVGRAGYEAAFTIHPGVVRRGADPFALPRVEVLASDTPRTLRLKVVTARWPDRHRERALRLLGVRQ
jgi:glycosyltransferase involved in cell wall biosynthesis/peptidoglycan/xylan/chitin deacetylase (PgdA/CDA1 family)